MSQVLDGSTIARGATPHPLDPLSADELTAAVAFARSEFSLSPADLFVTVQLDEPSKSLVRAWRHGDRVKRNARLAVWNVTSRTLFEGVVSLDGEVLSWAEVPGARAPGLLDQLTAAVEAARNDSRVQAALAERGITDFSAIHMEPWMFGGPLPAEDGSNRRLVWTPMWLRETPDDNPYAHPVNGVYAVVDLDTEEVLEVEDHGAEAIPSEPGHYRSSQLGPPREVSDLDIVQPNGPGFSIDGWNVQWQNWSLRVGFCPREGLLIHDVSYTDGGVVRPIAYRMSIAELVVPYADPSPGSYRKSAFDTGEVLLGNYTNSLEIGCDCLGEIRYFDVAVAGNDGTVREIPRAICMHEEDQGILWKHTDPDGNLEVRRSRRFTVSSIVTLENYEYGYFWHFYQDGSIEFEAKLTGVVLTLAGDTEGEGSPYSAALGPGLRAPNHQHMFCARLDLDIDGTENRVHEVDAVAPPLGPLNPYGGAFVPQSTLLESELAGRRAVDPLRARHWQVLNQDRHNRNGHPVGYKLVATHPTAPVALPDSGIGKRAAFMYHQLWVTPFAEDERYPGGDYPYQHPGGLGLPTWTAADRSIVDTDVVLWHVFGATHVVRTEDWPIMPVERVGFALQPVGFFDRNPSLDLPAPSHAGHHDHDHDHDHLHADH
jgi:primary-amine oxidase